MDDRTWPRFKLFLFGRFELIDASGPIVMSGKKLRGLLAYLAYNGFKPRPREELMNLLWGSNFESQAQQSLRQDLLRLRRILGSDALVSDSKNVCLRAGVLACDVIRFDAALKGSNSEALVEAAEIYRGSFLADVTIDEPQWADWLTATRQQLEDHAIDTVVKLAELHLQSSRPKEALVFARRAIAINPYREDAHRLMMRATAAAQNRALALRYYEDLIDFLKRELNIGPDAATRRLANELRQDLKLVSEVATPSLKLAHRLDPRNRPNVDWHPPCALTNRRE